MDVDAPDVTQIDRREAEQRPSAIRAEDADSDFAIVIAEGTWSAIQQHAQTRLDAEVGGILLGKVCRDTRETPYLLIDGHVAALEAESRSSNVTFTAASWTKIHESIDRDFPGAAIVGWYHTHPSFGIFLSEMDVFIHRHFFEAPHQVAIVIDPVANTHGGFAWRAGTPMPQKLLIEPGDSAPQAIDLRESFKRRMREREEATLLKRIKLESTGLVKFAFWLVMFLIAFAVCCYALLKWTPVAPQAMQDRSPSVGFDIK